MAIWLGRDLARGTSHGFRNISSRFSFVSPKTRLRDGSTITANILLLRPAFVLSELCVRLLLRVLLKRLVYKLHIKKCFDSITSIQIDLMFFEREN